MWETDLVGIPVPSPSSIVGVGVFALCSALISRIAYNLYFHPLSRYHGPWYAASFSIVHAFISVLRLEPQWMLSLSKCYGSKSATQCNIVVFAKQSKPINRFASRLPSSSSPRPPL